MVIFLPDTTTFSRVTQCTCTVSGAHQILGVNDVRFSFLGGGDINGQEKEQKMHE